jgi:hypothetical protein
MTPYRVRVGLVVNNRVYPFRPPLFEDVRVNGHAYRPLIITPPMQAYYAGECPCCESMLCMPSHQWTPTTTMLDIVFEICENLSTKRYIVAATCLDVIVRKYLVPDMLFELRAFL